MSNISRKAQRQKALDAKKETEKILNQQVNMFSRLPDECSACQKPFDKKSKEMAQNWIVVVRSEQKLVRLFCPECIDKVKEFLPDENEETGSV